MSALQRGVRDLTRKKLRTTGVVIVIGLALGVYLALSTIAAEVQDEVSYLAAEVESTIEISQNGSGGFFAPGSVNASILPIVAAQPHVTQVQPLVLSRYAPTTGAVQCGGGRRSACVLLEGENTTQSLVIYGGGAPSVDTGRLLGPSDEGGTNAMVGATLAARLGVGVGDALLVNRTDFTIVGTFNTGTQFGDTSVLLPYAAALSALAALGPSIVYVTVDSPANDNVVVQELRGALGSGYDVVALINSEIPAIQSAESSITSLTGLASTVALALGTLIIVFTMVISTRERVREIGLLKALGFRNSRIVLEVLVETSLLASLGFGVGLVLLEILGPSLTGLFTARSGAGASGALPFISTTAGAAIVPPWWLIGETLSVALLMGFIGALYPIVRAIGLRPAEALRYE